MFELHIFISQVNLVEKWALFKRLRYKGLYHFVSYCYFTFKHIYKYYDDSGDNLLSQTDPWYPPITHNSCQMPHQWCHLT